MVDKEESEQMIIAAAIKHKGKIYTGKRHSEIISQIIKEDCQVKNKETRITSKQQGFVTDTGWFLNRTTAYGYAYVRGQVKGKYKQNKQLFSEDLW